MAFPYYLIFPLAAGVGYAVGALMLKRAMGFGVGPWRITFFSNWAMGLVALPMLLLPAAPVGEWAWHLPIWPAITFFLGQIFTFLALFRGDVSVATPLMGSKILFVALLTVILVQQPIPVPWWVAAGLATAALGLLGGGKNPLKAKLFPTVPYALVSAFLFALTDIFVQEWAPLWGGFTRFIPMMFGLVALYSFVFVPFFRNRTFSVARGGWRWLGAGSLMLGVQSLAMAFALSTYGNATAVNIAYGSRGIWSVLLIWIVGHWFANEERALGRGVMTRRLIGAALLMVAMILVILS
jgi:drug/metabolite transporter (DMT)-like permease